MTRARVCGGERRQGRHTVCQLGDRRSGPIGSTAVGGWVGEPPKRTRRICPWSRLTSKLLSGQPFLLLTLCANSRTLALGHRAARLRPVAPDAIAEAVTDEDFHVDRAYVPLPEYCSCHGCRI
jgi:hypothetical protein